MTWNHMSPWWVSSYITSLAISPFGSYGGYIYAGSMQTDSSGIYFSRDGGSSWSTQSNNGMGNTLVNCLSGWPMNGVVFAGTWGGGIYVSTDAGASWVPVNSGLTTNQSTHIISLLAVMSGDPSSRSVFAGTSWGEFIVPKRTVPLLAQ